MKLLSVIFVIMVLATIVYATPESDKYTTKFDNMDIDAILENERLFNNYVACVEGNGKCTPEGEELKKHSKDALDNCCEKCSTKQKEVFRKIYKHLEINKPDTLKSLKAKFDPTGEYEEKCKSKLYE